MPSMNIVNRIAVETTVTKVVRGYSHVYQSGVPGQEPELRNNVAAIRNSICRDRISIGDLKQAVSRRVDTSQVITAQFRAHKP
jgi:hypothetical protein